MWCLETQEPFTTYTLEYNLLSNILPSDWFLDVLLYVLCKMHCYSVGWLQSIFCQAVKIHHSTVCFCASEHFCYCHCHSLPKETNERYVFLLFCIWLYSDSEMHDFFKSRLGDGFLKESLWLSYSMCQMCYGLFTINWIFTLFCSLTKSKNKIFGSFIIYYEFYPYY